MRKKIFGDVKKPPSYDVLKEQKEHLEHDFEQRIQSMEQKFRKKMNVLDSRIDIASRQYNVPSQKIIEGHERLKMGLEMVLNRMIIDGKPKAEIEEIRKLLSQGLA